MLRGGRVDRTDSDVICPRGYSLLDLLAGVTRYADDCVRREKFASDINGHVGLTEVDTVGPDCQGDVHPVIDNQRDFVLFTKSFCGTSNLEELSSSQISP